LSDVGSEVLEEEEDALKEAAVEEEETEDGVEAFVG